MQRSLSRCATVMAFGADAGRSGTPLSWRPTRTCACTILGLVALKVIAVWGFAAIFRVPARRPQLGIGLGQIGEFSFVVLSLGTTAGVVSTGQFSAALGAAAITIAASAVGARLFPRGAPQG